MKKEKFSVGRMLGMGIGVSVPTYEEVEASMLKAPEEGMAVGPSYNKKGELVCVEYKDNLSDKEALKVTPNTAVRMVSGRTQVIPGRAFVQEMTAKRAKTILGHKFWEQKPYKYYWERLFDDKRRLIETSGKIEGLKTFEYDENGRLSKINDFHYRSKGDKPVQTVDIAYDKQGRISHVSGEYERFGMFQYRDGETVKQDISFAYDAQGGYVVTKRTSVDGHDSQSYDELHCNKENDILLKIEKDSETDKVISKKDYTKSDTPIKIGKEKGIGD